MRASSSSAELTQAIGTTACGTRSRERNGLGEISIAPGETVITTVTFPPQGSLLFGCHLPGHFAYGMRGTITIA